VIQDVASEWPDGPGRQRRYPRPLDQAGMSVGPREPAERWPSRCRGQRRWRFCLEPQRHGGL